MSCASWKAFLTAALPTAARNSALWIAASHVEHDPPHVGHGPNQASADLTSDLCSASRNRESARAARNLASARAARKSAFRNWVQVVQMPNRLNAFRRSAFCKAAIID